MAFWRRGGVGWWSRSLLLRNCIIAFLPLQNSGLKVKNRSGQWEGLGGGELDGCIMHRVHTNSATTVLANQRKKKKKTSTKTRTKRERERERENTHAHTHRGEKRKSAWNLEERK
jgi:hypothetical protein